MYVDSLLMKGVADIGLRTADLVPGVIEGFNALLAEPDDYLAQWEMVEIDPDSGKKVPVLPYDDDPDDLLLVRRQKDGMNHDNKRGFHYRQWSEALLCARGVDYKRHRQFLALLDELHGRCLTHWIRTCAVLDAVKPGHDFIGRAVRSPFHVLRLLQYDRPREGTETIGKPHTDKCAATYHLAEEHPACRLRGELIHSVPDRARLFASKVLEDMLPGEVQGVPHDVVILPDHPETRWVIVFFAHLRGDNHELQQF